MAVRLAPDTSVSRYAQKPIRREIWTFRPQVYIWSVWAQKRCCLNRGSLPYAACSARPASTGISGHDIRQSGAFMGAGFTTVYHEYTISIVQADQRFTAFVTRPGAF